MSEEDTVKYDKYWGDAKNRQGLNKDKYYLDVEEKYYEDLTKSGLYDGFDYSGFRSSPLDYLNDALKQQGLNYFPNRFKQVWTEGKYKYEVRIHPGESQYTDSSSIYRVSRQVVGEGTEYLGSDGNWYHESVLKPTFKDGKANINYDANAAKITHIQLP